MMGILSIKDFGANEIVLIFINKYEVVESFKLVEENLVVVDFLA